MLIKPYTYKPQLPFYMTFTENRAACFVDFTEDVPRSIVTLKENAMGSKTRWRGGGGGGSYDYGGGGLSEKMIWIIVGIFVAIVILFWIIKYCCCCFDKEETDTQKCHCYHHCYCQRQTAANPDHTTQRGQELHPIATPSAPLMSATPMTELEYAINLSLDDCNNLSKSQHQETAPVYTGSPLVPNAPPHPSEEPQNRNFSEPPPPSYNDCHSAYYDRGNYIFEGEQQFQQRSIQSQPIHPAINDTTHLL